MDGMPAARPVPEVTTVGDHAAYLWDQVDLIEQFLANYDKLSEDLRAEIPLKRLWAVAATDEDGE